MAWSDTFVYSVFSGDWGARGGQTIASPDEDRMERAHDTFWESKYSLGTSREDKGSKETRVENGKMEGRGNFHAGNG